MRRLARVLGSLTLTLGALVLCAAAGEVALRLTSPTRHAGERQRLNVYRPSSTLSHELRPNSQVRFVFNDFDVHVRTNSLGFRGPEIAQKKPIDRVRILVVGDSFTFGWGVEEGEMFGRVLESQLTAAGVPAEVISAGVPGYATDQHFIFLRERGFALDPDLVVIAVSANDVEELGWKELRLDDHRLPLAGTSRVRFINRRGEMRFVNGKLFDLPSLPLPDAMRSWLVDHSWAYGWLRIRLARAWASGMEQIVRAGEELAADEVPTGSIGMLSPETIDRSLRGSEAFRLRYHRYLFDAIRADAAHRGVPLRTMLIHHAAPGLRDDCARSRCLDQSDVFRREDDPAAYLQEDPHWSARGHRLAGEALAAWLLADPDLSLPPL
jgi:hypothetical protein